MANVIIKISQIENRHLIEVIGSVDENFIQHVSQIPIKGELEFSLHGLKAINSTGIREWIRLMQTLNLAQITFSNCPKIFIDQVNMVSGFIPANSKVISFYVPYFNEDLDTETLVLYKLGEHYSGNKVNVLDEYKDSNGNAFEIDVVKSKYFKFIQPNN